MPRFVRVRIRLAVLTLAALLLTPALRIGLAQPSAPSSSPATIVRLDPRLDKLLSTSAAVQKLADGFAWVEGPVWDRKAGALLFSDIPNNVIQKWKEGDGVTEFLRPSGYSGSAPFTGREPGSNGLTFDKQGRLVMCQHGDRRIARLDAPGRITMLVDRYDGKRLNSPNDLVYKSNGDLYFTDPAYGLPKTFDDPQRELPFTGVYRLAANGTVTLLTRELKAPNGIAFSPDEKTLYVAQSWPEDPVIMAYPVKDDGTIGGGRVLINESQEQKTGKPGLPDGMKVDQQGNLWATGPGGVWILTSDGTPLGRIETGVATANLAWGDDGSMLYITANKALLRVKTMTKGKMP
jgi:gluconolactonase